MLWKKNQLENEEHGNTGNRKLEREGERGRERSPSTSESTVIRSPVHLPHVNSSSRFSHAQIGTKQNTSPSLTIFSALIQLPHPLLSPSLFPTSLSPFLPASMASAPFSYTGSCFLLLFALPFHFFSVSSALLLSLKNNHKEQHQKGPMLQANQTSCPLFLGSWVRDETYPIYQSSSCPIIDPGFNCQMNGRPDSDYLKYRWKPLNCDIPRFDGMEFLMNMREKTVMFVGDSLGRNQWESLICMILAAAPHTSTQIIRGDPLSTFRFLDYGLSVSFYRAPYLVDINVEGGRRILKLEEISGNGKAWMGADVLSFNTGHWWTHTGSLQGWDYMESAGTYYQDMDRLVALEKGLRTWSNWVDTNVDRTRTRVFFQSISPTHYNPSEWNAGGTLTTTRNCYGETEPADGRMYRATYPEQMRVVEEVMKDMKRAAFLLDITTLSELRKDGHPSIYSGDLSPEQRANPAHSADCSHWCLPGLPDTWNELFNAAMVF